MKKLFLVVFVLFISSAVFSQEVVYSGKWTKKSNSINGSWSVVQTGETYKVILGDGFKTKSAPDLKIFLSKKESGDINSDNATKETILVSPLKRSSGKQEYTITETIDISQYKTILIHCEEYSVLWGFAKLI